MARRSDHTRDELRDMAIEAALAIVQEQGPEGLSTRKVAARIGYTVGTLYHVFRNLDELILHVNAQTLEALRAAMHEAERNGAQPYERLLALGRAYLQFARRNTERWSLMFSHRLPPGETTPEWFTRRVQAVHALVEAALGEYAPHLPAASVVEAAQALWGGVHGICVLALSEKFSLRQGVDPEVLIADLFRNYLNGMTGTPSGAGSITA